VNAGQSLSKMSNPMALHEAGKAQVSEQLNTSIDVAFVVP